MNDDGKTITALAVMETWLSNDDIINIYNIKYYEFVYRCRTGKSGGGVGFYIHKSVAFNVIEKYSIVLRLYRMYYCRSNC